MLQLQTLQVSESMLKQPEDPRRTQLAPSKRPLHQPTPKPPAKGLSKPLNSFATLAHASCGQASTRSKHASDRAREGVHLQARQRGDAAGSAHGGARDGDGLRDVEERHGRLDQARVGMQAVPRNRRAQAGRVGEVLRLEALVPAVQRVEALRAQLLIPGQVRCSFRSHQLYLYG